MIGGKSMSQSARGRIFGLDLLRAAAIGLVLVCHLDPLFGAPYVARSVAEIGHLADVGVDLFFVLSGFLIGGILLRELERGPSFRGLVRFWSRRWWRTLPNYYLFLVLNMAVYWFRGHAADAPRYLAFMQGLWWDPDPRAFHESWSLCVEEWFYLSFAMLAYAGAAVLPRGRSYWLAALTVACGSFLLRAFLVLGRDASVDTIRYSTLPHLDSLMFGVVAAYAAARWPARWAAAARPAAIAGATLLAAGLGLRAGLSDSSAVTRLLYYDVVALGTALLLPRLSAWRMGAGRTADFVTSLSLYSYSMYLVNVPLAKALARTILAPDSPAKAAVLAAVWVMATYVLSGLCYHFYESRMTGLRDVDLFGRLRRPARPGSRSIASLAGD
jgi:peptidoglycan/LPS O-acetylase OafA/YrhL